MFIYYKIETLESFTGIKKNTLIYPAIENDTRLDLFRSKISYYVCSYPLFAELKVQTNVNPYDKNNFIWQREFYVRNNCIPKALQASKIGIDNRLVILGDIDEIPSVEGLNVLKYCNINIHNNDNNTTFFGYNDNHMMSFVTNRLHFNFHCRSTTMGKWNKPSVVPMISLRKKSVRDIRKETKFDFAMIGIIIILTLFITF